MTNQYASTDLTIDISAILHNYNYLKSAASGATVACVVKADAYGLGVAEIASNLAKAGCGHFFVANLDEALALRKIVTNADIFVLHGIFSGQEHEFCNNNITPVLNSDQQITVWQQYATEKQTKLPCIIHFDTGMHRLGLCVNNKSLAEKSATLCNIGLDIKFIMSHLACADDAGNANNDVQLQQFIEIASYFPNIQLSLANSAGIFLGNEYHFNLVRPGIALYGVSPSQSANGKLQNVIKLTSRILQIERIDRAGTVGYGAEHKVNKGTKIATIAAGYADGYLRSLSNKGICALRGKKIPVIGRVSMDLITLDVTEISDTDLGIGKEIELIGENISVDMVAEKAGTIAYEILTSLGARYKRIYKA